MEIPKEIGKQLKNYPTACRAAIVKFLSYGFEFEEIKDNMQKFIDLEKKLNDSWYRKMLNAILDWRIDPETYAYEIATRLRDKTISPEHAITLVNRRLQQLKAEGHRPSRMLEQIKKNTMQYVSMRRKFFKYAVPYIIELDFQGLSRRVGETTAEIRRQEEDKLFQMQVLHHLRNKQEDCKNKYLPAANRKFPEDLLPQALSTSFSSDQKIAYEQIFLVDGFFDNNGDMAFALNNPMLVKQQCFQYISDVLCKQIPHVALFSVSFKDGWVSKEIYDIYMAAYDNIHKYGMTVVVYQEIKKLYDRFNLMDKKKSDLMIFERRIIDLEAKYRNF